MEFAFFVYLTSLAGSIKGMLLGTAMLIAMGYMYSVLFVFIDQGTLVIVKKRYVGFFAVLMIVGSIIPSERTMWMMAGAYASQTTVQSNIGQKVLVMIEQKIDKEIEKVAK